MDFPKSCYQRKIFELLSKRGERPARKTRTDPNGTLRHPRLRLGELCVICVRVRWLIFASSLVARQSRQRQSSAAVGPPRRDPNLNLRPLRDRRFSPSKASLQVLQQGLDLSRTWYCPLIPPSTPPWQPPLPNRQRTYLYPEPRR